MTTPPSALPELVHALGVISGVRDEEIRVRLDAARAHTAGRNVGAVDASAVVDDVVRRVRLSPTPFQTKEQLLASLAPWDVEPHGVSGDDAVALAEVARGLPMLVPVVSRDPVVPAEDPQTALWLTLVELDRSLDAPWCVVGGRMVALHCLENGVVMPHAPEDGDVVVGAWTHRDALTDATALLRRHGYREDATHDGCRYQRGESFIDLFIPQDRDRQRRHPTTDRGRPGLPAPAANQALTRTERVAVRVADAEGFVPRPNLLGALVSKAAAVQTDLRDNDRHCEDLAILGSLLLRADDVRAYEVQVTAKDRRRVRAGLGEMPADHPAWRLVDEGPDARSLLVRFSEPRVP